MEPLAAAACFNPQAAASRDSLSHCSGRTGGHSPPTLTGVGHL
jgi:hypothetical protein